MVEVRVVVEGKDSQILNQLSEKIRMHSDGKLTQRHVKKLLETIPEGVRESIASHIEEVLSVRIEDLPE